MAKLILPLAIAGLTLAAALPEGWCQDLAPAVKPEGAAAAREDRVAQLIAQLGASDFSTREKAQAELGKLGLTVFDALSDAQHHEDIEIALRARFLVRSMHVQWHEEGDSPAVVQLLRSYGELSELDRKSRIDLLRTLPGREGVSALCRLARFEVSDELSKQAALHVFNQPPIDDPAARAAESKKIASIAGAGKRTAAAWLRTYAKTLDAPESALDEWDAHAKAEHELLTQFPERTSREIVRDLYRWQVTLLQQAKSTERAIAVIRQSLSLMEGTPEQLAELVSWLIHREVWSVVEEVVERFPQAFAEHTELTYLRAEAFLKQGQLEKAEQYAKQALDAQGEMLEQHRLTAERLKKRGLFAWAQREYEAVIQRATAGSDVDRRTRFELAEMFHDLAKEREAAETLQAFFDAYDKEMAAKGPADEADLSALRSRLHYFHALYLMQEGKTEEAVKHLDQGIKVEPYDADVLIALYRLPDQDEERRKQTRQLIDAAAEHFRTQINKAKAYVEQELDEASKATFRAYLANACNQFAWLVSNTTGDFDEALQCSLKSNELMPKYAAYLDTLGRCYFAKGDYDNAIRSQTQALLEEPHSGQMKRQLELFEKTRDEKNAAPPKPDVPQP